MDNSNLHASAGVRGSQDKLPGPGGVSSPSAAHQDQRCAMNFSLPALVGTQRPQTMSVPEDHHRVLDGSLLEPVPLAHSHYLVALTAGRNCFFVFTLIYFIGDQNGDVPGPWEEFL